VTGRFESPAYDPALFSNETLLTFRHHTMNLPGNVSGTIPFDPQEQYRKLSDWIAPDSGFVYAIIVADLLGTFVALWPSDRVRSTPLQKPAARRIQLTECKIPARRAHSIRLICYE
jgi:hypothetical protein